MIFEKIEYAEFYMRRLIDGEKVILKKKMVKKEILFTFFLDSHIYLFDRFFLYKEMKKIIFFHKSITSIQNLKQKEKKCKQNRNFFFLFIRYFFSDISQKT